MRTRAENSRFGHNPIPPLNTALFRCRVVKAHVLLYYGSETSGAATGFAQKVTDQQDLFVKHDFLNKNPSDTDSSAKARRAEY
jgi:hypothetical protein